jgi:hypothetical protein
MLYLNSETTFILLCTKVVRMRSEEFVYGCYQVELISLNDLCCQITPNFRNTFKFKYLSNISMDLLP